MGYFLSKKIVLYLGLLLTLIIFNYGNIYHVPIYANEKDLRIPIEMFIQTNSPILGNHEAPVTIFEFSDFQCSMCARYAKNTEPEIVDNYIVNGKVRIVFKHFPILGPDSSMASLVSQCVNQQGKFWDFYKILYTNQKGVNSGWASKDNLIGLASTIPNLEIQKLIYCVDTNELDSTIQKDFSDALNLRLSGTPSFLIVNSDGSRPEMIAGSQPFPSFQTIISNKLQE